MTTATVTAIAEVANVWNIRNNITPLSEEIRSRIKQIRQDIPETSYYGKSKMNGNWKHSGGGGGGGGGSGSGSGGGSGGGSSGSRGVASIPVQKQAAHQPAYQKYQSRFKKIEQAVDEKILYNVILSKLNKFSSETFKEIELFLCQILDSGENEFIKDFMLLVFKKAASEEVFCSLYARLISNLSRKYPQLLLEMKTLYKSYLTIFEEIQESDATSIKREEIIKLNTEKAYRRGYSQFLAELAGLEVLDRDNIIEVFIKLTELIKHSMLLDDKKALVDEYCDCLLRMSRVIKKSNFYKDTKLIIKEQCAADLSSFTKMSPDFKSLTSRTKFQCMEIFESLL
jgi:hypothetical protein